MMIGQNKRILCSPYIGRSRHTACGIGIGFVVLRFGFEAELIIKALRIKKNNIAEVPVKYFPRNYGEGKKLRNTDAFKILWTIFKYGVLGLK